MEQRFQSVNTNQQFGFNNHCVKYRNFTYFPGVEILWKDSFAKFRQQEIGEITLFYAVNSNLYFKVFK